MHANALEKVVRQVEGCLKRCQLKDNWPEYDSIEPHVDPLAAEILKHRSAWLSASDVYSIFYDLVYEAATKGRKPDEKLTGGLWEILGEHRGRTLRDELVAFFQSIPRPYEVFVPLGAKADGLTSVELNERFAIEVFENPNDVPGGYTGGLLGMFAKKLEPALPYLRYRMRGYCSGNLRNATMKKALSHFKIAFQQGIAEKVFVVGDERPSGLGFLSAWNHFQFPKVSLVAVDKSPAADRVVSAELAVDVSRLIDCLGFNSKNADISEALSGRALPALLHAYFRLPALLIENEQKEAERIKAAAQWCFDSYATENETMSFLQACFGLEALFGDEAGSEALTSTLADRCAYLVASDIKGRANIRSHFRELYEVRSKLVHGSKTSLDQS